MSIALNFRIIGSEEGPLMFHHLFALFYEEL